MPSKGIFSSSESFPRFGVNLSFPGYHKLNCSSSGSSLLSLQIRWLMYLCLLTNRNGLKTKIQLLAAQTTRIKQFFLGCMCSRVFAFMRLTLIVPSPLLPELLRTPLSKGAGLRRCWRMFQMVPRDFCQVI